MRSTDGQVGLDRLPTSDTLTIHNLLADKNKFPTRICVDGSRYSIFLCMCCSIIYSRLAHICALGVKGPDLIAYKDGRLHRCTGVHVFHGIPIDSLQYGDEVDELVSSGGESEDEVEAQLLTRPSTVSYCSKATRSILIN